MKLRPDQAASLRDWGGTLSTAFGAERGVQPMVAVASGKGGVGKTCLAVNLAMALRDLGHSPLLMDLDWGLANVDVALGLVPKWNIGHLITGECALEDVLLDHDGVGILPNGCGQAELSRLDREQRIALLETVRHACRERDLLVADTHPGIGAVTIDLLREAHVTLVVCTPEPTALTDTYALFKVLDEEPMQGPAGLVINQASSREQAEDAAAQLDAVARRFLGHGIDYWGFVVQDAAVPRAVRQQRALLAEAPRSGAARSVREIAQRVAQMMTPADPGPDHRVGARRHVR